MYDGGWKDKAAEGYGVMKWQNGDRSVVSFSKLKVCRMGLQNGNGLGNLAGG